MKYKFNQNFKSYFIYLVIPSVILFFLLAELITYPDRAFDLKKFDVNKAYSQIEELSSSKYDGRMAGTQGNNLALKYLENSFRQIGVEPAGSNGTYYQNFESIVPVYDSEPVLNIIDSGGKTVKSYKYGQDFRDDIQDWGGSGEETAPLLNADKYLTTYEGYEIKNKIIFTERDFTDEEINYAMDNGVLGIITEEPSVKVRQGVDVKAKQGRTILMDSVTADIGSDISNYAGGSYRVEIKTDVTFKPVVTSNFLGKIQGRNSEAGCIILAAHIDSYGSDFNGGYYPGSLDDASGAASLIEIARAMKQQSILPDKTIIFALWNNEVNGFSGSNYYADHPVYPLSETEVISIDDIGGKNRTGILLNSSGSESGILSSKIAGYSSSAGIRTMAEKTGVGSDITAFSDKDVPSVLLGDDFRTGVDRSFSNQINVIPGEGTFEDNINSLGIQQLNSDNGVVLQFIKHEIYGNIMPDFLNKTEKIAALIYFAGIIFLYYIYALKKTKIRSGVFKRSIHSIHNSIILKLLRKMYYYATLFISILLFIICVNDIPSYFTVTIEKGRLHTDLSLYLFMLNVVSSLRNFFLSLTTAGQYQTTMRQIISVSFIKDIKIISLAVLISFTAGVFKGVMDGYSGRRKRAINGIGSIFALSIPDVLIIILVLNLIFYLDNNHLLQTLLNMTGMREFIIPLLCLCVIPTVYISRITTVAFLEEMEKGYVKAAKARGLSSLQIIKNHILLSVIIKVVESFSSILTMIISNLMILEYLYFYPGIAYNLMKFYAQHDMNMFIGLVLCMGLIYIVYNLVFKFIAYLINPLKKEAKRS